MNVPKPRLHYAARLLHWHTIEERPIRGPRTRRECQQYHQYQQECEKPFHGVSPYRILTSICCFPEKSIMNETIRGLFAPVLTALATGRYNVTPSSARIFEQYLCQARPSPQRIMEIYGQGLQRSMSQILPDRLKGFYLRFVSSPEGQIQNKEPHQW